MEFIDNLSAHQIPIVVARVIATDPSWVASRRFITGFVAPVSHDALVEPSYGKRRCRSMVCES